MPANPSADTLPEANCGFCPRLEHFRRENRKAHPDWHNAPVVPFGDMNARLLIVGLAPGLRGANRTGRPFTGDFAGDLLYTTLIELGLAEGDYRGQPDDGLRLVDCRISNAVKCVPPQNKPSPEEIATCNRFLKMEIAAMRRLRAILALGRIAHDAVLIALAKRRSRFPFAHGRVHDLSDGLHLFDSFHCSRYNTNTNRLTTTMFKRCVRDARDQAKAAS